MYCELRCMNVYDQRKQEKKQFIKIIFGVPASAK